MAEKFDLRAHKGLDDQTAHATARHELAARITAKVFETGDRVVLAEFQNESRYPELSSRNGSGGARFASAVGFPIKAKEKVIGVLHLASKLKRRLAPDELKLIESIAQEIGVAVENARLFEQVNQKTTELAQMNEELQEANQAKSDFISAMSHELRTPLNVIMGNAELMGDSFFGEVNEDQKTAMAKIRYHAEFLLKLVNDVLALSRLDAKKMSLELATVNIQEIVAHAQSHIEQLNRVKGLQICWDIEAGLPDIVTDATKLEEILQNLLGNAFKFTPQGRIDVRIRNLPERCCIEFSVADTGIGIEVHDLDRIFRAFEQIKEAHTGEFNGVGLGLNIVKNYLDLMNGDIRVESHVGEGSTFTFWVPYTIGRGKDAFTARDASEKLRLAAQ
jgi:signal transduction histidine kinase